MANHFRLTLLKWLNCISSPSKFLGSYLDEMLENIGVFGTARTIEQNNG